MQVHMKLAVNCAVNPFTALLGCLNNAYSENPHGQQLAEAICNELFELYGQQLLGKSSGKELADFVLQVLWASGIRQNGDDSFIFLWVQGSEQSEKCSSSCEQLK